MATELRRYVVKDGGLDTVIDFFAEIRELRQRFGFTVEFAAADRQNSEFIWAVSHANWADAIREYEQSVERSELFASHSMPLVQRDLRMVELVSGRSADANN